MVVDDHPAFREGLSRLLSAESDLEIVAKAEDGEQARMIARQSRPDVIIMDISLPKLNGIEAAKLIKAEAPGIAILMVSANNSPFYIQEALKAGAAGFLLKEASLKEIISAVRLVCSGEAVFDMQVTGKFLHELLDGKKSQKELEKLHPRELQVLALTARGIINKEIARSLNLSERTVQSHLVHIYRKMHVCSRTEAVLQGLKTGLLSLQDLPGDPGLSSGEKVKVMTPQGII